MNSVLRLIICFIVAPAVIPGLLLVQALVVYLLGLGGQRLILSNAAWIYAFSLGGALLLGIPAYMLAVRLHISSAKSFVIGGMAIGAGVASSFFVFFPIGFNAVAVFAFSIAIGGISALAFWSLAPRQRAP